MSDAIKQGDMGLASELAQMLIALDGYVHRKVNLVEDIPVSDRLDVKKLAVTNTTHKYSPH